MATIKISTVRKILSIITIPERNGAVILLGLMFVSMALEMIGVGLVIPMINVISAPDTFSSNSYMQGVIQFLEIESHESLIVIVVLGFVSVYIIKNLFLGFFSWYKIRYISNLRMNISNRLFKLYLHQPYTFHLQRNSGQLIQNISIEVTIFTGRLLNPLMSLCTEGLVLLGIALVLVIVEPIGALIVIVVLGAAGGSIHYFTRKHVARWGRERQYHEGKRLQRLQEGLGGVKDALFLGRELNFLEQYEYHNASSNLPERYQSTLQEIPRLWFELLAVTGLSIIILVMVAQGREMSMVFATLGVFAAAAFRLMPSVTRSLAAIQSLRYSMPVLETLHDEFQLASLKQESLRERKPMLKVSPFNDSLTFKDVSFTYQGSLKPSIHNLSLSIKRGDSIGVIGSSGAGKSTLVDTLLGLLEPDNGEVLVDGINIQENLRAWQDQIGYVPQSIYLVDDTLRNNVAFGIPNEEINEALIVKAIQSAQLEDFIESLPDGLDTIVGERGVRLSGGQRQRIGIARALYYEPEILVLDEATSSLDNETETEVMRTVQSLHRNKTIIIVAHRLTTVEKCDRLYRLKHGSVIDEGVPDKILVNGNN